MREKINHKTKGRNQARHRIFFWDSILPKILASNAEMINPLNNSNVIQENLRFCKIVNTKIMLLTKNLNNEKWIIRIHFPILSQLIYPHRQEVESAKDRQHLNRIVNQETYPHRRYALKVKLRDKIPMIL